MNAVYMDYNATTPVLPEVATEVMNAMTNLFGNASSTHGFGLDANRALKKARNQVARLIHAHDSEIIFTSGATESINTAIRGVAMRQKEGGTIVTTSVEHKATLEACKNLQNFGFQVEHISTDRQCQLDLRNIESLLDRKDVFMLSMMLANNETGSIFPVKKVARLARARGVTVHVDATCAVGYLPIDVKQLGVDLLSFSGHKIYAPKGIGVLYKRNGLNIAKHLHGGGQENNQRAGTENLPGIVGLGKACDILSTSLPRHSAHVRRLRDRLIDAMFESVPGVILCGSPRTGLPNTTFLSFKDLESSVLIMKLNERGIAVSNGSACSAGDFKPSHVLTAMHLPDDVVDGAVRFSLGRPTTDEEVAYTVRNVAEAVEELRA